MWHAGWHEIREPRFRGHRPVTCPDDSSWCIMASMVFTQAAHGNTMLAPGKAVGRFGTLATMLTDNGSCLVGRNGRRDAPPPSQVVEAHRLAEIPDRGIESVNSRPYRPQANDKRGWFHRSAEGVTSHYENMSECRIPQRGEAAPLPVHRQLPDTTQDLP